MFVYRCYNNHIFFLPQHLHNPTCSRCEKSNPFALSIYANFISEVSDDCVISAPISVQSFPVFRYFDKKTILSSPEDNIREFLRLEGFVPLLSTIKEYFQKIYFYNPSGIVAIYDLRRKLKTQTLTLIIPPNHPYISKIVELNKSAKRNRPKTSTPKKLIKSKDCFGNTVQIGDCVLTAKTSTMRAAKIVKFGEKLIICKIFNNGPEIRCTPPTNL